MAVKLVFFSDYARVFFWFSDFDTGGRFFASASNYETVGNTDDFPSQETNWQKWKVIEVNL